MSLNYWVISASTAKARIFSWKNLKENLVLIKEINNPDAQLQDHDLVSDRPGHYQTAGYSKGTFGDDYDPKKNSTDHFAKTIVDFLEKSQGDKQYSELIISAAPHFLGLINQHLKHFPHILIKKTLSKDYTSFSEIELMAALKQELFS